jgi:alkylation response protein AidB-like acyl-CoA dehydrogenase
VYADSSEPRALVAEPAGAATAADGGVRVSGRWKFASGVSHSNWITLGAIMMENGQPKMTPHGPEILHVAVPTSEIEIIDTWYVNGLRGTGSFDVAANDVFVPESRCLSLFDPSGRRPEPLYQMPTLSVVAPPTACVALGIARAALDELYELAPTKVPALSMVPMAQKPVTQVEIARAEGMLGGARSFIYDAMDDMWQTVQSGQRPTKRQEALLRIAANQVTEVSARVAQLVSTLAGGTAVFDSSLQRHARDAEVITHHMTQSQNVWEDAGRMLFGFDPLAPIF